MAFTGAISPNVVKTALDDVFFTEYEDMGPMLAHADDEMVFRQSTADSGAVIMEVFKGVKAWEQRSESADVNQDSPLVGDQITYSVLNYANSVDISKNLFDDNKHDVVKNMMREFAEKARVAQDKNAYGLFRNGFGTTLTADGAALYSNTHTTLSGDTVDNLGTATLSETSLNTGIIALAEQVDQAGEIRGHQATCLLVPPALFKTACEIAGSEWRSGTANNDDNVYLSKYGIYVKQSQYLGAAAGGSDTAWFLSSKNHSNYRWVRDGIATDLVEYKYQRNNDYIYKGEYREMVGAVTYEGSWASNGTV